MYHPPFVDKVQSPTRQLTLHDRQGSDVDGGFELTVAGMEMGWWVIVEKHPNLDPVEGADRRHQVREILPRYIPEGAIGKPKKPEALGMTRQKRRSGCHSS
jgi:hypothetical protein